MFKLEWKTCLKVGVSIFLLYMCIHYFPAVSGVLLGLLSAATPLFIGCAVAFIVNVLMSFYEKHYFPRSQKKGVVRSRRPVCLLAAYLTLFLVVVAVFWLVIPEVIEAIQVILRKLPSLIQNMIDTMKTWSFVPPGFVESLSSIDWAARINQVMDIFGSGFGDVVNLLVNTVTSVFSGVFAAVISLIFSVYLLGGKERIYRQACRVMERYMPKKWGDRILYFARALNINFRRYIVGQSTEAVILGTLVTIGMLILGLPYATMVGALVMVMAFIPIAGAYISGCVGALMLMSDSPVKAIIFVVFFVVLQQIEGNLIYPRVVGSSLGLPPIWVLAAVIIGGGLFGIFGMVLAVPLTATLYYLMKNSLEHHSAKEVLGKEKSAE